VIAGPHLPVGDTYGSVSYLAYVSMREGAKSFANLACWADLGEARPVVMRDVGFGAVHFVSGNYFDTLGVHSMLGRTFRADDDTPATTAAILSYPFWQRAFGGSRDVLRKTIDLNGKSFAIIGVMPPGFFGVDPSSPPDVMVPTNAVQMAAATNNPIQNPRLWQICRVERCRDTHCRIEASGDPSRCSTDRGPPRPYRTRIDETTVGPGMRVASGRPASASLTRRPGARQRIAIRRH
jgi:hypothetical protein